MILIFLVLISQKPFQFEYKTKNNEKALISEIYEVLEPYLKNTLGVTLLFLEIIFLPNGGKRKLSPLFS